MKWKREREIERCEKIKISIGFLLSLSRLLFKARKKEKMLKAAEGGEECMVISLNFDRLLSS